ncbi:ABC transporter ATP-binding protein [Nesterenkonia cremea]|uniref:ABC transporter ATP-binding protein n=1 Tax=Nesterenkonia cremea TaxID=1882340 RepID=A0A917ERR3_9MICC|nr:ABC transporter ATP-binding protein [Nesterenkonia cremea]GGE78543.1 ABC transporter ATP-binding protein [Nesterenkonia cremea]
MSARIYRAPEGLQFDGITVERGRRKLVTDADFTAPAGQVTALVGPNGSGKSTLLKTAYRLVRPDFGTVRLDGEDLWQMPRRQAARQIAVMAQESQTVVDSAGMGQSVLDIVLMARSVHHSGFSPDTDADLSTVVNSLETVQAGHLADRGFTELSGGEKQRVLLARALAQGAGTLLLDEPTNHLDIAFQMELLHIVRELGLTAIVALHDLNLALAYCDYAAVLSSGRLIDHGPVNQVLTEAQVRTAFGVRASTMTLSGGQQTRLAFQRLEH